MLVPTGGIRPDEVPAWIAAGATAVGIGDGLPADPAELAALFAGPACGPGRGAPRERGPAAPPRGRAGAHARARPTHPPR
ncbi:hypothetical protein ACFWHN_24425, partial [Streptomyces yangpuensis]